MISDKYRFLPKLSHSWLIWLVLFLSQTWTYICWILFFENFSLTLYTHLLYQWWYPTKSSLSICTIYFEFLILDNLIGTCIPILLFFMLIQYSSHVIKLLLQTIRLHISPWISVGIKIQNISIYIRLMFDMTALFTIFLKGYANLTLFTLS